MLHYITKCRILNTYRKQQCSAYSEELKSGKGNRICRNLNYEPVYLKLKDKKLTPERYTILSNVYENRIMGSLLSA